MNEWTWFLLVLLGIFFLIFFWLWKRTIHLRKLVVTQSELVESKAAEIETKTAEIETKTAEISKKESELDEKETLLQNQLVENIRVQQEKDALQAKYLAKLAAAEEKKKNLAAYHAKKQDLRQKSSIAEQAVAIVGKGAKWLPHSCTEPKSHRLGKPRGSHGKGRRRPTKIHGKTELHVGNCSHCGADLADVEEHWAYTSVLTELFREQEDEEDYQCLKLKNIEQHIYRKKCPHCHKWTYPQLGLLKNCRFGLSFVSFVISDRIVTHLPYLTLIKQLQKTFGKRFRLSATSIVKWFIKFELQLKALYDQLAELITHEDFMHIDESGLPMQGENWWLWVLCSANIVLYQTSASRGHESVEQLLENFKGTIIADFFRAYDQLTQEQQKCLAHLLSAIIEVIVGLKKENDRIDASIVEHEQTMVREQAVMNSPLKKTRGRPPKDKKLDESQLIVLAQRKQENLTTIAQASRLCEFFRQPFQNTPLGWKTPPQDRITAEQAQEQLMALTQSLQEEGITDSKLETLIKRCEKYQGELFTYLKHEGMPPDNNPAERELRPYTVQRKVSGGFKSPEIMKHYAVYLSLFMTCKLNGKDFDDLLARMMTEKTVNLEQFFFAEV